MTEQANSETRRKATTGGIKGSVGTPFTISSVPTWSVPATATEPEGFTRDTFGDTLDRVSRPVKGRYADALPSSKEFIRDKRREVELEDRPS